MGGDAWGRAAARGVTWALYSIGPARRVQPPGGGGNIQQFMARDPDVPPLTAKYPGRAYDPTNGTESFGWIIRSNMGVEN
ncbi:MAG: hypothetical protein NTW86_05305 [Candidatus Sumerlaeota bacterium]|nr:hypothetical protein [Candidatus Sumerlaeota bacterium]